MEKLAQSIKVSRGGLINMLANNSMRVDTLMKIAEVLDVDISYFLSESKSKTIDMVKELKRLSFPHELRNVVEIDQLTKRIRELEILVDINKTDLFISQKEFLEFAKNIWEALINNKVFKNKKVEGDFREIFYSWLYRMQYSHETIANIKDKKIYELFSKLIVESEQYWKEFLKEKDKEK